MIQVLQLNQAALSVTEKLLQHVTGDVFNAFASIGIGIGSLILMFLVVYYAANLYMGGQFQLKMLVPILIYICLSNFKIVSTPVIYFTQTITKTLVAKCDELSEKEKESHGLKGAFNTIMDIWFRENDERAAKEEEGLKKKLDGTAGDDSGVGIAKSVKKGTYRAVNSGIVNIAEKTTGQHVINPSSDESEKEQGKDSFGDKVKKTINSVHIPPSALSLTTVISLLVSWIAKIMRYVMIAFGAIMTALIVAFGPITFAFAMLPGQAGTIKSWFIRLCQYSLWAPIAALIDCFAVKVEYSMAVLPVEAFLSAGSVAEGGASMAMTFAVALCNLVALCQVPTIASMIIEGAQGAASLSQGLSTIASGAMTATSVAGLGAALISSKGSANSVTQLSQLFAQKGFLQGGIDALGSMGGAGNGQGTGFGGFNAGSGGGSASGGSVSGQTPTSGGGSVD